MCQDEFENAVVPSNEEVPEFEKYMSIRIGSRIKVSGR